LRLSGIGPPGLKLRKQFREYAEEAMQWARRSRTEEAKKVLIELALTWTTAASLSERKSVCPPEQRV